MTPGFGFHMSYTVNFEKATVDYDLARTDQILRVYAAGQAMEIIKCPGPDGYIGEITHFFESIRTQRPPSTVTVDDAMDSIAICEAEEESVRTRAIVEVQQPRAK